VERLYSQGLYRVVSAMFAASFGRVPFSLGEALLWTGFGAAVALPPAAASARARAGRRRAVLASTLADASARGSAVLAFVDPLGTETTAPALCRAAGLDGGRDGFGATAVCES